MEPWIPMMATGVILVKTIAQETKTSFSLSGLTKKRYGGSQEPKHLKVISGRVWHQALGSSLYSLNTFLPSSVWRPAFSFP